MMVESCCDGMLQLQCSLTFNVKVQQCYMQ